MNSQWSEEERLYLIGEVHHKSDAQIAQEMRDKFKKVFTHKSVEHMRRKLGIRKSQGRRSRVVDYRVPMVAMTICGTD